MSFIKNFARRLRGELNLPKLLKDGLKVGKNFSAQPNCIIDPSHCWHIEIGDDVTLAPRAHILAHDSSTKQSLNYTKVANVKIGNQVFIGASAIILPGVTIGDDVIIGAGSIVTKDIPSDSVAVGNPASVICTKTAYLEKQKGKMTKNNCFDESFTTRQNVSNDKKKQLISLANKNGQIFIE